MTQWARFCSAALLSVGVQAWQGQSGAIPAIIPTLTGPATGRPVNAEIRISIYSPESKSITIPVIRARP